ncbi:MAG: hypothetical protein ACFE0J_19690 [Elainellaceae cyanobacterium]
MAPTIEFWMDEVDLGQLFNRSWRSPNVSIPRISSTEMSVSY